MTRCLPARVIKCGRAAILPAIVSLNYFRAKVKRTRKTKDDKEHLVAEEEVKQDPAPEEDQKTAGTNLKGIRN